MSGLLYLFACVACAVGGAAFAEWDMRKIKKRIDNE